MHIFHHWQPAAVEHLERGWFDLKTRTATNLAEPLTEVLQRCKDCGTLRTVTLTGHWTLSQLGERDAA